MKKLLGIVVLGFLWCNVGIANHLCGDNPFKDLEHVSCVDEGYIYNKHTCKCESIFDSSDVKDAKIIIDGLDFSTAEKPKELLIDKFKNQSTLIIIVSIILIIIFFFIKFRVKSMKSIELLFRKIKSPFKNDLKRVMLTLSVLYLGIMYYLNWWGHQSSMFIYKMTYSWFIRWGLIPVVAGWIIYYIWRKEK